jgi:hypothetical protein
MNKTPSKDGAHRWRTRFAALMLVAAAACGSDAAGPPSDGPGILFIGNSLTYTNDLPGMLGALILAAGADPLRIEEVTFPDVGLPDHWEFGPARETIEEGTWDIVVLQQGPSATEGRPYLLEYSELFAEEIRAAGGQPALYMVWPSQTRFFDFDGVSDSYVTAAELVDGLLFPAGEAWRVAWERDPDLELYGPDGFHPSVAGTYLAALVIFEQMTGMSAVGTSHELPGTNVAFDPAVATLLQEAAHEANRRFAR